MKKYTDYVNVFQGNSTVSPEPLEGICKTWAPIKGLSGNTHPGALRPFGKMSVCAYSGGYPTGYGNNKLNCGEPVEDLYDKKSIIGVTHLQHSGTGAVGFYYNYALTVPYSGSVIGSELNTLVDEKATPGYYSARFLEKDVYFELTTDKDSAFHRYTFSSEERAIAIDMSNDGLYGDPRLRGAVDEVEISVIDNNTASAIVICQGIKMYYTLYCNCGNVDVYRDQNGKYIVTFVDVDTVSEIIVTVSLRSYEHSLNSNIQSRALGFDNARADSISLWNDALSRIDIETDDRNKEIFYSNLYHTLVKPCDWSGESIYYQDQFFVTDFVTLWDIYKTQLPLLFSVYPDISKKIISTYVNLGKTLGVMPNLFALSTNLDKEAQQARFLISNIFCDAFYRGVEGVDWNSALDVLVDILFVCGKDFFNNGECSRTTHTLDLSEACINISAIAQRLKRYEIVERLKPYCDNWRKAFDVNMGLLKEDSEYYEGNHWNYSFRLLNSIDERIALANGKDGFIKLLDKFFGFSDPTDVSARFEGFNNETDMESPYAYNYVGRQDRLAEIIEGGNKYLFTTGEGGVPGNADSGGLTACYVWNCVGLFPVSGQDLMLIGMPYFDKATVHLSNGKSFTVVRHGNGGYVKKAVFDSNDLNNFRLTVTEMMRGGTLNLYT